MEGFIVMDYAKQWPEARKELAQWLSEGKIQRKETIIKGGLAKAESALIELYNGVNTGKWLNIGEPDPGNVLTPKAGKLLVEVLPEEGHARASL